MTGMFQRDAVGSNRRRSSRPPAPFWLTSAVRGCGDQTTPSVPSDRTERELLLLLLFVRDPLNI